MRDSAFPSDEPLDCSKCASERHVHGAALACLFTSALVLASLVIATAIQYDGFEFDRPVDLYPVGTSVVEWGGWSLVNQRLRFAAACCALAAVLAAVGVVTRRLSGSGRAVAVLLFLVVWPLLVCVIIDSNDVARARARYSSSAAFECKAAQYVTTCVLDALAMAGVALSAVLVLLHSWTKQSGHAEDQPSAAARDGFGFGSGPTRLPPLSVARGAGAGAGVGAGAGAGVGAGAGSGVGVSDREWPGDERDAHTADSSARSPGALSSPRQRSRGGVAREPSPRAGARELDASRRREDDAARRRDDARRTLLATRAVLGIKSEAELDAPGIHVIDVFPHTPAARAGLAQGDVIFSVAGMPTDTHAAFKAIVESAFPGEDVEIAIQRGGRDFALRLVFGGVHDDSPLALERLDALRRAAGSAWVREHEALTAALDRPNASSALSDDA